MSSENKKELKDKFLALEASAGSGKTFALSVRFVAIILENDCKIYEILALTFTKKAANEMKERIIETFLNLHSESKKAELQKLCEILDKSEDDVIKLRDQRMQEFLNSDIKISTIDSFFSSILRAFALNIGINPTFEMNENIKDLQNDLFIDKICSDEKKLKDFVGYLVRDSKKNETSFLSTLDEFVQNDVKDDRQNNEFESDFFDFENSEIKKICLKLNSLVEKKCDLYNGDKRAKGYFDKKSFEDVLSLVKKQISEHSWFKKIYDEELEEEFINLKKAVKKYFYNLQNYKLNEFFNYIGIYKEAKEQINKKLNSLTFLDATLLVKKLFESEGLDGKNKDMLYFRLDSKIKHLLIDEFQDTNVIQYEILFPLIEEIISGEGQNGIGSFFYVGDKKQSIYRFRGGKKELFDQLKKDFSQIKNDSLDTNYRSLQLIVKFVNHIFKDKIKCYEDQKCNNKEIQNIQAKKYLESKLKSDFLFRIDENDFGFLKICTSKSIKDNEDNFNICVIDEVKNLKEHGANIDNIAILCFKNKDCESIKDALNKENILATTESRRNLDEITNTRAVIEYAKYCITKEEIYAKNIEAILGFEPKNLELDLNKNTLENLQYLVKNLNLNIDENMLLLFENGQKFENIIEFAFSKNYDPSFSNENTGVKVMTYFKSKGLQFEHVILCDDMSKRSNIDRAEFISEYDLENKKWDTFYRKSGREFVDEDYLDFKTKIENLETEISINVLYVGCTRAKKSLIIVKKNEDDGGEHYFDDEKYLKLEDFGEFGYILPDEKVQEKENKNELKNIELLKIPPQNENYSKIKLDMNYKNIYFGIALHYLLEMCVNFDEQNLQKALILSKNRYGKFLNRDDFLQIENRALNLIRNEKFKNLINQAKIYKEQSFKIGSEIKRIDLLLQKDDEIIVVDYKSFKYNIEKNIEQVEFYKEFLEQRYKNMKIKGIIIFILESEVEFLEI